MWPLEIWCRPCCCYFSCSQAGLPTCCSRTPSKGRPRLRHMAPLCITCQSSTQHQIILMFGCQLTSNSVYPNLYMRADEFLARGDEFSGSNLVRRLLFACCAFQIWRSMSEFRSTCETVLSGLHPNISMIQGAAILGDLFCHLHLVWCVLRHQSCSCRRLRQLQGPGPFFFSLWSCSPKHGHQNWNVIISKNSSTGWIPIQIAVIVVICR